MKRPALWLVALILTVLWARGAVAGEPDEEAEDSDATAESAETIEEDPDRADDSEEATRLFGEAEEHYLAHRYEEALGLLEQAFELDEHPLLIYNIGQSHRHLDNFEPALAAYRQYLELCPREELMTEVYALIGECLICLGRREEANEAFQRYLDLENDGEQADQVRRAVETGEAPTEQERRDPDTVRQAQELHDRAEALLDQDQYEQAALLFIQGYERMPDIHELLFNAGLCYLDGSMMDEGMRTLARYVQTPDADPLALYFLGEVYAEQCDFSSAIEAFERYLETAPDGEWRQEARAFINELYPAEGDAAREETGATPEEMTRARALSNRAWDDFEAERYAEALQAFEGAYEIVQARTLICNMAGVLVAMERREEAVRRYEEFLEGGDEGEDASVHVEMAECLIEMNRIDEARRHIDAYMERARASDLPDEDAYMDWARNLQRQCESRGGSGDSSRAPGVGIEREGIRL